MPFFRGSNTPVPYEGPNGIGAILNGLAENYGWEPYYEGENVIALTKKGAGSITLEPAGQFELSGAAARAHPPDVSRSRHAPEAVARCAPARWNVQFLGLGFSPKWSFDETPMMPKARYKIMREYMPKVGRLGRQMMFRSCTVQTNLDFGSRSRHGQEIPRRAWRCSRSRRRCSPIRRSRKGALNGFLSYRGHVWTDTDPDRTGMLPFVFEEGFGFEQYAEYALDVPMYFVKRDGKYIESRADRSANSWPASLRRCRANCRR